MQTNTGQTIKRNITDIGGHLLTSHKKNSAITKTAGSAARYLKTCQKNIKMQQQQQQQREKKHAQLNSSQFLDLALGLFPSQPLCYVPSLSCPRLPCILSLSAPTQPCVVAPLISPLCSPFFVLACLSETDKRSISADRGREIDKGMWES